MNLKYLTPFIQNFYFKMQISLNLIEKKNNLNAKDV